MKQTRNPNQLTLPHRSFSAYDVDVHGDGFRGALVMFRSFKDTKAGLWASVSLVDGLFRVDLKGLSFSAPARGNWRGKVRVPALFFVYVQAFPPEGEWFNARMEHDRLSMGQLSVEIDRPWNRSPGQRGSRRPPWLQNSLFALEPRHHASAVVQPLSHKEHETQIRLRKALAALWPLGVRAPGLLQLMDQARGGTTETGRP